MLCYSSSMQNVSDDQVVNFPEGPIYVTKDDFVDIKFNEGGFKYNQDVTGTFDLKGTITGGEGKDPHKITKGMVDYYFDAIERQVPDFFRVGFSIDFKDRSNWNKLKDKADFTLKLTMGSKKQYQEAKDKSQDK